MFKIIRFKQLAIISFSLCLIMLMGTCLNAVSPYVYAISQNYVNVPVIMYHQIHSGNKNCGDYIIPISMLEDDFEYMDKNNINPISFSMLLEFVNSNKLLPPNPVIITFDDGEKSFITKVVPLLEKYNFPANVNIIGALVKLYTENGETDDSYAYLSQTDVKILSRNPLVELGCHTYNLHSLGARRGMAQLYGEADDVYTRLITDDIQKFNDLFYEITGTSPFIFAYPYGINGKLCKHIVENNGFTVTLTCRETVNKIAPGYSLMNLGRFNRPYSLSTPEFFDKIMADT